MNDVREVRNDRHMYASSKQGQCHEACGRLIELAICYVNIMKRTQSTATCILKCRITIYFKIYKPNLQILMQYMT